MIDANDKQTQPLALDEQPAKAKRGRPATGAAMTNAERQRAYRERQKAQRNDNPVAGKVEFELGEKARKRVRELEKELKELKAMYQLRSDQLEEWIAENTQLKAQLAQRNEYGGIGKGKWVTQYKIKGDRKWKTTGSVKPVDDTEEMRILIDGMNTENKAGQRWRAIRDDGLIYDPKDPG